MSQIHRSFQIALIAIACSAIALTAPSYGQEIAIPQTPDSTQSPESVQGQNQDQPVSDKSFAEIIAQMRKNEREINRLFSSIPIGFPKKQKMHMEKIEQLRAENLNLKDQMAEAALRAYRANPNGDPRVAAIVFNLLTNKVDVVARDGNFDPKGALEIGDMMLKGALGNSENPERIPSTDVAYQVFRASYAIEDLERADWMLKNIESAGITLRPIVREQLAKTKENFDRELMIRRLEASTNDLPRVKLETTAGDIVVELFENHAPQTVGNFISLVEKHLYDDLTFFHVKPGEFAQTGCPLGNGLGDPGYKIPCEFDREQIRHHFSGTLSMVTDGRDTGGSQFRIMHQPNLNADGKYTAFGRVIEGMDVVYQLKKVDKTQNTVNATEPSKIIKATVIRKRDHEYPFSRIAKKPNNSIGPPKLPSSLDPAKSSSPGG